MTVQDGPQGAPDIDAAEIIAAEIRDYFNAWRSGKSLSSFDEEGLAEDIITALRLKGCDIEYPTVFMPKPIDMEFSAYGVSLCQIGEDGDNMIALGHVEPRRMVAALNRYWRTHVGLDHEDIRPDPTALMYGEISHGWAEFTSSAAGAIDDYPWFCWSAPSPSDPRYLSRTEPTAITRWFV